MVLNGLAENSANLKLNGDDEIFALILIFNFGIAPILGQNLSP